MVRSQTTSGHDKRELPTLVAAGRAVLVSRVLALAGGMANSLALPLVLAPHDVGLFFLSQVYLAGASVAALLGLTYTAQGRLTAAVAIGELSVARRYAIQALAIVLLSSVTVAVLTAGAALLADASLRVAIWIVAASVPLAATSVLCVELLRGYHLYRWAANLTLVTALAPITFLVVSAAVGWPVTLESVLTALLVASALAAVSGLSRLILHLGRMPAGHPLEGIGELLVATMPNFVTTITLFLLAQLDIVLLGILATPEQVAHYGIATRLAYLLLLPFSIANSAFGPIAIELHASRQLEPLRRQATSFVAIASALAVVGYGGFALLGPTLIDLWNPGYANVHVLFLLLGCGQVLHVFFGAGGSLLMLLGHQVDVMRSTIAIGLVTAVGSTLALWFGGTVGLASVSAVGNAALAFVLWQQSRRRIGVDTWVGAFRP